MSEKVNWWNLCQIVVTISLAVIVGFILLKDFYPGFITSPDIRVKAAEEERDKVRSDLKTERGSRDKAEDEHRAELDKAKAEASALKSSLSDKESYLTSEKERTKKLEMDLKVATNRFADLEKLKESQEELKKLLADQKKESEKERTRLKKSEAKIEKAREQLIDQAKKVRKREEAVGMAEEDRTDQERNRQSLDREMERTNSVLQGMIADRMRKINDKEQEVLNKQRAPGKRAPGKRAPAGKKKD